MQFYMLRLNGTQFYYKPSKFRSKKNWVPQKQAKVYATIGRAKSAAAWAINDLKEYPIDTRILIVHYDVIETGTEIYE